MSEAQRRATDLARFYFRRIAEQAGMTWDGDNDVEIELMVGFTIDAAAAQIRGQLDGTLDRIRQLENRDDMDGALNRIEALERRAGMPDGTEPDSERPGADGTRFCPETGDGLHCGHWPDGEHCCACGQGGPEPDDEADEEWAREGTETAMSASERAEYDQMSEAYLDAMDEAREDGDYDDCEPTL